MSLRREVVVSGDARRLLVDEHDRRFTGDDPTELAERDRLRKVGEQCHGTQRHVTGHGRCERVVLSPGGNPRAGVRADEQSGLHELRRERQVVAGELEADL
jgi:hypothetical protein